MMNSFREPKRVSKSASWKAQAQAPYQSLSQLHKKIQVNSIKKRLIIVVNGMFEKSGVLLSVS
ncbi:hypothetical protein NC651_036907 [Populus alba x Populus x berolinensis]|nr:hypothetical protein NC651_036907 [Populus alba x Populus x berolinensis]